MAKNVTYFDGIETEMKRQEALLQYINANPEPDQNSCPNLWIYWKGKNKDGHWAKRFNVITGEIVTTQKECEHDINEDIRNFMRKSYSQDSQKYIIHSASSQVVQAAYFKYIPELECMETSFVSIKLNRSNEESPRKYVFAPYHCRYFIFKDNYATYCDGYQMKENGVYYNNMYVDVLASLYKCSLSDRNKITKAIKDFTGLTKYNLNKGEWANDISHIYNFISYYKTTLHTSKGSKSSRIGELESIVLPEIDDEKYESAKVRVEELIGNRSYSKANIVVCQNINNDYIIFRIFSHSVAVNKNKDTEVARLYISKDGKPSLARVVDDKIYIVSGTIRSINWACAYEYIDFNKELIANFLPLKYIFEIVEDLGKTKATDYYKGEGILNSIINLLRHPIIEQLWKAGYHNMAKALCIDGEIAASINNIFKAKEKKNISFYTLFGVNKHQMKRIDTSCIQRTARGESYNAFYAKEGLKFVREMMEGEKISDIDDATFDKLYNFREECLKANVNPKRDLIYQVGWEGQPCRYGWRYDGGFTPYDKQCIKKVVNLNLKCKDLSCVSTFKDCVNLYCRLSERNHMEIDLYSINSERQLGEVHDNLLALDIIDRQERERLWNMKAEERNKELEKKMKTIQEKRIKNFEFSDDEYSIIVPKHLGEITQEGISQSHCVGSYLESVAKGNTNILFLRKNDDINHSFYTIEATNDNKIVQIHGHGNKWLGNNPEAIPFVISWLKAKNISCDKKILLSTSLHYGIGTSFLNGKQFGL